MQLNIVYSVYFEDYEQTYVGKTDRQTIRRMKEHGAPSSTFEQEGTADQATNEEKLRRSTRIHGNKGDLSKLPNTNDNMDHKKVVLLVFSKHEYDTGYRINWKDFHVVWRDENPYRLLFKEPLMIQACKLELNRTTHCVPLVVFSDGLTTNLLLDRNG
jgi:hypothetical protein